MGTRSALAPSEEGAQAADRANPDERPEPVTSERYPRRVRLARGSELEACWREGRRVRTPHLDLAWHPNLTPRARAAIVVPRYQFTAVARNRLRRRLREIVRRSVIATLPPIDVVVRAKRAAYDAPFAVLRAELADAGSRLR